MVIDESHNFRNDGGLRYARLIDDIIKQGARTKVLMMSATPVNTSLIDLRNQIYLMTEKRDDVFRDSLGISNVGTVLSGAQEQFKNWENQKGKRDKAQLLERLGADFLGLLNGVSIARSRRQIKQFYAQEVGGLNYRIPLPTTKNSPRKSWLGLNWLKMGGLPMTTAGFTAKPHRLL